ncbi:ribosomal protein S18-alanine N-acetyltransferase [Pseudolactococcus plantarum]|uniref:[Ribosomal protein bS18]-alanine N-acetyltransferase n=1 Tax=Pseudolactococcus plantarum TaxID=1365 RepID=A0A2A5S2K2_9LACT|nr:ribosomal protein S18-alanine N-acetyltransferase [Lactococcus plantarum]PCS07678.1 alanine acetyltransferase [Lactococcus plantarum]HCN75101.1 ribosomal-protein-alanine N-acetyltransferase [Lactococcus sp.]
MNTDGDAYAAMVQAILVDVYDSAPWTLAQTVSDMNREETNYYLALEANETVIGFLATSIVMDEIEITNLAVSRAYQHQGIASLLLNALLNQDGKFFLEVRNSNQKARQLYEKHGFETYFIRRNYYQNPNEDALLMKREK